MDAVRGFYFYTCFQACDCPLTDHQKPPKLNLETDQDKIDRFSHTENSQWAQWLQEADPEFLSVAKTQQCSRQDMALLVGFSFGWPPNMDCEQSLGCFKTLQAWDSISILRFEFFGLLGTCSHMDLFKRLLSKLQTPRLERALYKGLIAGY